MPLFAGRMGGWLCGRDPWWDMLGTGVTEHLPWDRWGDNLVLSKMLKRTHLGNPAFRGLKRTSFVRQHCRPHLDGRGS